MQGDPIVDKHILDIISRSPSSDVEVSKVKIKKNAPDEEELGDHVEEVTTTKTVTKKSAPKKATKKRAPVKRKTQTEKEIIVIEKTKVVPKKKVTRKKKASTKKVTKKKTTVNTKKPRSDKHVKDLKKKVKEIHSEQKKHVTTLKKEFKKSHEAIKKHLSEVHKTVEEGKNIYVPEPRPSLENQMLIESMNKLTAVVKQLVVLFNQKVAKEEGPLFAKLNEIMEQNEKIAQGILTVADLIQEDNQETAVIRPVNPYKPRLGPQPETVRPQMQSPQEVNQNIMPPQDLGRYQQTAQAQPFMGPVPQNTAPMPPGSSAPQEKPVSPKRMLF